MKNRKIVVIWEFILHFPNLILNLLSSVFETDGILFFIKQEKENSMSLHELELE